MSLFRLIVASLAYHWRSHAAVAVGVAAATAVLTGALLVGDSMRGSLLNLTLQRLGRIDAALAADRFFRAALADELAAAAEFSEHFTDAVPAVFVQATLESADAERRRRVNEVNLLGCDMRFWQLGSGGPEQMPGRRGIVLNRPAADQLGVSQGDAVLVRLPRPSNIPADSPLGRKTETIESVRVQVEAIVPAEGLGRFALRPSQRTPANAYMSLEALQQRVERPGGANLLLIAGPDPKTAPSTQAMQALKRAFRPKLADFGLSVEATPQGYYNVTSERMLLSPPAEQAVVEAASARGLRAQPALTYLANTIAAGERDTPYSTVTALEPATEPPLGPLVDRQGKPIETIGENEIVLNAWTADDLQAEPGDTIGLTFFEPESTHGQMQEQTAEFTLVSIVPMEGAAADRHFTPEVAGVTDEESIGDWNPPFPFDAKRIRDKDEAYWEQYRATPKAFVSLKQGRELWGSRFGQTTSLRVAPSQGLTVEEFRQDLREAIDPAALGLRWLPIKQRGLEASAGTTPFSVLFLAFSFFIIAAAVMLVVLLFLLGMQRRAGQIGTLLALGLEPKTVRRALIGEGLVVAAAGSVAGLALGVGYAALMLWGLQTLWVDAIVTPFLELHVTPLSLGVGLIAGTLLAWAAMAWSVRRLVGAAPSQLLSGNLQTDLGPRGGTARRPLAATLATAVVAVLVVVFSARVGEEMRAGLFFAVGALVLVSSLGLIRWALRTGRTGPAVVAGRGNLARLALRNAARNPGRSSLSVGLIAAACFLIVAVSAFHMDPVDRRPQLNQGDGGFALVAESSQPLHRMWNTAEGRQALGFSDGDGQVLAACNTIPLRVVPGDDASCLNLYKPQRPRIAGVPEAMIERGGFAWAAAPADVDNPWTLLAERLDPAADGTPRVPVILEKNTANYSLHLWEGLGETLRVQDGSGRPVQLVVVALLSGSLFQGELMIAEDALLEHFPEETGWRMFLIECAAARRDKVARVLESTLGDYGLAVETSGRRLADYLAVQNTYLSTFQSLGGLGLLLGTVGLAAVQLRNVLSRRSELALLQATGFTRGKLAALVVLENAALLLAGLGCGALAAVLAVLPHWLSGAAEVPWLSLTGTLGAVLLVGVVAGLAGAIQVLRAPLIESLRAE
jgi:ABC-type lipoprotein release transport system permease subunit